MSRVNCCTVASVYLWHILLPDQGHRNDSFAISGYEREEGGGREGKGVKRMCVPMSVSTQKSVIVSWYFEPSQP